jgi:arginase
VIWVDAHGDLNTPRTTPSGNIHGMALACLLGEGPEALTAIGGPGPRLRPEQAALIATRDLDPPERERLAAGGLAVHTMHDVDELGIAVVARRVLEGFAAAGIETIHVSFDLDGLDPTVAPGVGTPVPGGLSYREAHLLMEILSDSHKVRSMDIVEVNPILDDRNRTALVAVELAASLWGQRIL